MSKVNIKDVQQKLYDRLKPSGWANKLKTFILSDDFTSILQQLLDESQAGNKFTPVIKQLFRAFEECPYSELKVIMLNAYPHPKAGLADGLAFSSANDPKHVGSLKYIHKAVEADVMQDTYSWETDLARWSNQGILLLNTNLTTTVGKVGPHEELWKPFMAFLLDILAHYNSGLIYVFFGKHTKQWSKSVPGNNYKFFIPHPAVAAHRMDDSWDNGDMFNNINKILKKSHNTEIIW